MIAKLLHRWSRAGFAAALAVVLVTSACSIGGDGTITISAAFTDVRDLVERGSVRAGDIIIGTITDIELTDDYQALVTMEVKADTGLPADVRAVVNRTSILGEKFVDIQPQPGAVEGTLADGTRITDTDVVADLENLVFSGNDLLAAVSANQVAATVRLGAEAFGDRGAVFGQLLTDLRVFVGEFDEGTPALLSAIDALDAATARLAPNAARNAATLEELREAAEALQAEDDRLVDALDDLQRLGVVGERILSEQGDQITEDVRQLRLILDQLTRIDGALQNLLTWMPRHNQFVPLGTPNEQSQVWLDFIVCGINDTEGDPSRACDPPNPGEANSPPAFVDESRPCLDDVSKCEDRNEKIAEGGS